MELRVIFMGSPEFAVPVLQQLATSYPVVGVVTQPDRPAGRGRVLTPPPIKLVAVGLNLPVIQPQRLSEPAAVDQLRQWSPDLIVVAAFGQILRPAILDLPRLGCVNVHASLLPRWRGAAPIQAAILNGDDHTGVTIMRMDAGVDTGPILSQKSISIGQEDTAGSIAKKLSDLGANLLVETLPSYISDTLVLQPQNDSFATYAPLIKKEQELLDFSKPAIDLARKVRAFNPKPGAFTMWNGQVLKIHMAHAVDSLAGSGRLFTVYNDMPAITTGDGLLVIDELQLAGRRAQSGREFLRGIRNWSN